ncbi:hypothetical protein TBLA_0A06900 [Henningerozyma blattae CBS 6284]|uniref:Derlin n=1 Tax=Henningerozyma blattae (strain ATCC 34711 / CBS 6284 / DSM 70876 / NBRC 10599 / NRRL Y-10934 / UCD 77-7) TaxID=1071380 RepID=I2GWH9_HENB6|nr:hypothetical protein TBLA_0A06900 [Tetrapisispora blattae CBS 6284]CCH58481.1 hypothetical protein TBLA_0A06900 [Tetrapisispora blattae CBS 6284]
MTIHTLGDKKLRDEDKERDRDKERDQKSPSSPAQDPLPPVTRVLIAGLVLVAFCIYSTILDPSTLVYSYTRAVKQCQIWRLVSGTLLVPFDPSQKGIGLVMELYNFYTRSVFLENNLFACWQDYAWYLVCIVGGVELAASVLFPPWQAVFIYHGLSSAMAFNWAMSDQTRHGRVVVYGVLPVPGYAYPLLDLVLTWLFGGAGAFQVALAGIGAGYLWQAADTGTWGVLQWELWPDSVRGGRVVAGQCRSPVGRGFGRARGARLGAGGAGGRERGEVAVLARAAAAARAREKRE